jgi:hypothetical protein
MVQQHVPAGLNELAIVELPGRRPVPRLRRRHAARLTALAVLTILLLLFGPGGGVAAAVGVSPPGGPPKTEQPGRSKGYPADVPQFVVGPYGAVPRDVSADFLGGAYGSYEIVDILTPAFNEFWGYVFGSYYSSPAGIYWYNTYDYPGTMESPCGLMELDNSYYCPYDGGLYLDQQYFDYLITSIGDYAAGVLFAHEWAHHVQNMLGIHADNSYWFPIHQELQADCLSGITTRYLESYQALDAGDLDEAITLWYSFSDPEGTPWDASYAHGTGEQRVGMFLAGYEQYSLSACWM